MNVAVDSSVIIAAINEEDPGHEASLALLLSPDISTFSHSLSETFSILTGGRLGFRLPSSQVASILKDRIAPRLKIVSLTPADLLKAYAEAESRGIRGGSIYDYLHLFAARKAGAERFHTLNLRDFNSFHRPGDPAIADAAE